MANPHLGRSYRLLAEPVDGCPHCHAEIQSGRVIEAWDPIWGSEPQDWVPAALFTFACGWKGYLVYEGDEVMTPYGLTGPGLTELAVPR